MANPKLRGDDMLTIDELKHMRSVDIASISKDKLVDLETVRIDDNAPYCVRARQFFQQIHNPFAFRVGNVAVKTEYMKDGGSLKDALKRYLISIKDIQ